MICSVNAVKLWTTQLSTHSLQSVLSPFQYILSGWTRGLTCSVGFFGVMGWLGSGGKGLLSSSTDILGLQAAGGGLGLPLAGDGLGLLPAGGGLGFELDGGRAGLWNGLLGASSSGIESLDRGPESSGGWGGGLRPTIELLISLCLAANSLNTWLAGELKIWEWNHNITLTKPKHKMLNAISHNF